MRNLENCNQQFRSLNVDFRDQITRLLNIVEKLSYSDTLNQEAKIGESKSSGLLSETEAALSAYQQHINELVDLNFRLEKSLLETESPMIEKSNSEMVSNGRSGKR